MGEWGRFRDPGLMRTRQYGDLKFYKDNYLSEMDAPAFNNMGRDQQLGVATFASVYPDVQIRFVQKGKHGESGAHWVQEGESFVEINTDSPFALEAIMAHENTHHLEVVDIHYNHLQWHHKKRFRQPLYNTDQFLVANNPYNYQKIQYMRLLIYQTNN